MNVSEQIIEVIDSLCEKFGIAIDWTANNVIPYIETLCTKFINYEIYTSIFWICFMVALSGLCWLITGIAYPKAKKLDWDDDYLVTIVAFVGVILSNIVSLITIIVIGCQVYDIVVAKTFPEKVIYDYIVNLISTSSCS